MGEDVLWEGINTSVVSKVKMDLQLQASYLGKITNNVVQAKVTTNLNIDENANGFIDKPIVTYCFEIFATILDYTRFSLFCVEQTIGVELPLKVSSNYWAKKECNCDTIDDFKKCLKEIFSSNDIISIINSIIATSK